MSLPNPPPCLKSKWKAGLNRAKRVSALSDCRCAATNEAEKRLKTMGRARPKICKHGI